MATPRKGTPDMTTSKNSNRMPPMPKIDMRAPTDPTRQLPQASSPPEKSIYSNPANMQAETRGPVLPQLRFGPASPQAQQQPAQDNNSIFPSRY